jgi:hypothetical protein
VPAKDKRLAVAERARCAVGIVGDRDLGGDAAADRLGIGCGGKEVVERAALVGLEMREGEPAQASDREDAPDRLRRDLEGLAVAGVEEQRFVAGDQVLVVAEAAGEIARRHRRADAVDAVGDFIDAGVGGGHGVLAASRGASFEARLRGHLRMSRYRGLSSSNCSS